MQATAFDTPPWWQRVLPMFRGFDGPLLAAVLLLAGLGLTIMYSSGFDHGTRFVMHGRNMLLAVRAFLSNSDIVGRKNPFKAFCTTT